MHTVQRMVPLALGTLFAGAALAADHNEAPGAVANRRADIDDVYVWPTGDGKIVAIVTFGGQGASSPGAPEPFDADVLYGIHIDNDGDLIPDRDIWVRFGQDGSGAWGVQFENVPGASGTVSGPLDTTIDAGNGLRVAAGVYDDPFFFDFQGLLDTLNTAAVSFDSTRDSFAGRNTNAIVVEMATAAATDSNNVVRIWSTTASK